MRTCESAIRMWSRKSLMHRDMRCVRRCNCGERLESQVRQATRAKSRSSRRRQSGGSASEVRLPRNSSRTNTHAILRLRSACDVRRAVLSLGWSPRTTRFPNAFDPATGFVYRGVRHLISRRAILATILQAATVSLGSPVAVVVLRNHLSSRWAFGAENNWLWREAIDLSTVRRQRSSRFAMPIHGFS